MGSIGQACAEQWIVRSPAPSHTDWMLCPPISKLSSGPEQYKEHGSNADRPNRPIPPPTTWPRKEKPSQNGRRWEHEDGDNQLKDEHGTGERHEPLDDKGLGRAKNPGRHDELDGDKWTWRVAVGSRYRRKMRTYITNPHSGQMRLISKIFCWPILSTPL